MTDPRRRVLSRHAPLAAALLALTLLAGMSASVAAGTPGPHRGVAAPGAAAAGTAVPRAAAPARIAGLTLVKGGLSQPVFVTHAGDARLFVVERTGKIKILRQREGRWRVTSTFLDLRRKVSTGSMEQGLLGLAFHPDYAANGRFYVDYTNRRGDTIVAELRRSKPGRADPASLRRVLRVGQPADNHNGGWLGFRGQHLYISLGDGGSAGDPWGHARDTGVLLGKILRVDPRDPDGAGRRRYSIPSDNPFVGRAGRDEIWSYGLRNPWRASFDRLTGDLWIGDVGQARWEEVDHAADGRGRDFGWDRLEGTHRYPSGEACVGDCRTLPVAEYRHGAAGCSVTGGYVSRRIGAALEGRYVFGDYCSGRIWAIPVGFDLGRLDDHLRLDTSLNISSFGEGADGALYVVGLGGTIHRIAGS